MRFIKKIMALIKPEPRQEQLAGYSKQELKSVFARPLAQTNLPVQPPTTSLESADICAFFSQFLIDPKDLVEFESLVESHFRKNTERTFNDLPVFEYESALSGDRLIFFASTREFNSVTIRLITNSLEFLTMLTAKNLRLLHLGLLLKATSLLGGEAACKVLKSITTTITFSVFSLN